MIVDPIKTKVFSAGDNLVDFIVEHVPDLPEKSVLVVTSKIVALSENRIVSVKDDEHKEQLIKDESEIAIHHPYGWLSVRNGLIVGSAGIDGSNVGGGNYVLLPHNSFKSAQTIRKKLIKYYKLTDLGVIVTDSRLMPLRKGTLGAAFGYAGFKALKSYIGKKDIYGREFLRQQVNVPDGLASAAVFVMGEGDEQFPLALIKEVKIEFTNEKLDEDEMKVPVDDDIYYYFFRELD